MTPLLAAALAIAIPLLSAPLALLPGRAARHPGAIPLLSACGSFAIVAYAFAHLPSPVSAAYPYAPQLLLSLSLLLDRLSLFFALVVTGVGALVIVYALGYLHDAPRDRPRFFATLLFLLAVSIHVRGGGVPRMLLCTAVFQFFTIPIAAHLVGSLAWRKEFPTHGSPHPARLEERPGAASRSSDPAQGA